MNVGNIRKVVGYVTLGEEDTKMTVIVVVSVIAAAVAVIIIVVVVCLCRNKQMAPFKKLGTVEKSNSRYVAGNFRLDKVHIAGNKKWAAVNLSGPMPQL